MKWDVIVIDNISLKKLFDMTWFYLLNFYVQATDLIQKE
jgi:hypothetical protein